MQHLMFSVYCVMCDVRLVVCSVLCGGGGVCCMVFAWVNKGWGAIFFVDISKVGMAGHFKILCK